MSSLFADPDLTFIGRSVRGDLSKIGADFNCAALMESVRSIDIGTESANRGLTRSNPGLEAVVEATLGIRSFKPAGVRLSKWSNAVLNPDQLLYAALDVALAVRAYDAILKKPDLTIRLPAADATAGTEIDIVASRGSINSMISRAANASIAAPGAWPTPAGWNPKELKVTALRRRVTVSKVLAPALVVPYVTRGKERLTLGDLGAPPFDLVLPLTMLAPHLDLPPPQPLPSQPPHSSSSSSSSSSGAAAAAAVVVEPENMTSGGDNEEEAQEDEDAELDADDVSLLRAAEAQVDSIEAATDELGPAPESITDRYSSVLGDSFHGMDRPKVPVHHDHKKGYFVALRRAWFVFDPVRLDELKGHLRSDGLSDEEIEAKEYYDIKYFRDRVPRIVPPPSTQYHRVRAVFEVYGKRTDGKTGAPLFNKAAWKKASNLLKEILCGYYADPPGYSFYSQRLNSKGEPAFDEHGMELIDCNRGTNDVENSHKQIVSTFGGWHASISFSDDLHDERRHRLNHGVSERKRPGFPIVGHVDDWLIDQLQNLVFLNHGVILYPGWANATDYIDTPELFGTVPLHSAELGERLSKVTISAAAKKNFTPDMVYICNRMDIPAPFLPVDTDDEKKLFRTLVAKQSGVTDFEQMALTWCEKVDGVKIFSKLPVYLRTYSQKVQRIDRIKDAVRSAKKGQDFLNAYNQKSGGDITSADSASSSSSSLSSSLLSSSTSSSSSSNSSSSSSSGLTFPPVQPHSSLLPAPASVAAAAPETTVVGGTNVGAPAAEATIQKVKRKHGQRSGDIKKRAPRKCKRCLKYEAGGSASNAETCKGRASNGTCQYWDEDGTAK